MTKHLAAKAAPPCRLFSIFARQASRAVIIRRGPTQWTQLILWHTDTDEVECGQWFKARVYERRCDLSPDGTKLIYFARKVERRTIADEGYTYAWTAISRPPYWTALALWPKGDCWNGGGLFQDNKTVVLNHWPEQSAPHAKHLPQGLTVYPNPLARGEDDPIFSRRLARDGWQSQETQPDLWMRTDPSGRYQIRMTRYPYRLMERESFEVTGADGVPVADAEQALWVDWDQRGRLVVLKDGKLFIGEADPAGTWFNLREVTDYNPLRPEPKDAPEWATKW